MILRNESLTWQVIGDDLVVLDLAGSVYLKLNGTARFLWERLADGDNSTQLVDALLAEYAVDRDDAAADVDAFLADLRDRQLLESE